METIQAGQLQENNAKENANLSKELYKKSKEVLYSFSPCEPKETQAACESVNRTLSCRWDLQIPL
jgi:hypothetical protein